MKHLPEQKELLEILEMARIAEQKARETSELAYSVALKWKQRLENKLLAKDKQEA